MYKVKQKLTTLLMACFAVLVSMLLALSLWTPTANIQASAATATDTLNRATTGITNTSYAEWSNKTGTSGAVYAGNSAGGNTSIQLRSNNSNSGIITTTSGGKIKKVSVVWNSSTSSGRTLNIYGRNTAYTKASELYNTNTQGTLLGTIKYGSATLLNISKDYEYIGVRSSSGALYLTSITFEWELAVEPGTCEHNNKTEVSTTPATCATAGEIKYSCPDCGETITEEIKKLKHELETTIIKKATCQEVGRQIDNCKNCDWNFESEISLLPHDFENIKCTMCGLKLPAEASLSFASTANRTLYSAEKQIWEQNNITFTNNKASSTTNVGDYSNPVRLYASSTITLEYPRMVKIQFTCSSDTYATALKNSIASNVTVSSNIVTVTFTEPTDTFTATISAQTRVNSLKVYTAPSFDGASVTLGEDITLNYYATIAESLEAKTTVVFNYNEKTVEAKGEKQSDGRYKYSVELAPQYMTVNVNAKLYFNGKLADEIAEYSIATYAYNKLNDENSSEELKRLVSDMLYYGAAAQKYKGYNTDNLASNVAGILDATDATPETTNFNIENAEADSYSAYFKGAGVYFDNVNSIYVKLNTTEKVTLMVNNKEVAVKGTTVYTDGINATAFADTYTFALYYDGQLMQTLTYSVNAYAYAMKDRGDNMGELALALYNYGLSAKAYKPSLNA